MEDFIFAIIFGIVIFIILCVAIAGILRWIFKIHEISGCLEEIRDSIKKPWHKCESCGCFAPDNYFQKIDSGQMICNDCREYLKSEV